MTHEQFQERVPVYVLGALDGSELREFEQYVSANSVKCDPSIAEFQTVTDQLVFALPQAQPAPTVFENVMTAIGENERAAPQPRPILISFLPWAFATAACVALFISWTNRQADQRRYASAIATTNRRVDQLLADKAELIRTSDELRQQIDRQRVQLASLQRDLTQQSAKLDLMMDAGIEVAQLSDPAGKSAAIAKVYWHMARQTGLIVVSDLTPVMQNEGKSLELWAICGDKPPVPAGLFWTDQRGHGIGEIRLTKQVDCAPKFAVSIEPIAGVPAPTGPIVLLGH